jgi:phosphoglycolate phosphatase-like HAD superfamily hydrolase
VPGRILTTCCIACTTSRPAITSVCWRAGAIPLREDVGQLICDARTEGVRLAISSSSKLENVVGLLRANLGPNADSWFDAIASGAVAAAKKPSPEIYLWNLAPTKFAAAGLPRGRRL